MNPDRTIPAIQFSNLFLQDPSCQTFLPYWMGQETARELGPHLVAMGQRAALATPLSARADQFPPQLQGYSAQGQRIDQVVYHPDYEALQELAYEGGIVALKYDRAFLEKYRPLRHLMGFSLGYLFAQTEMGLYCPICMTDGVGRVLERHSPGPLAQQTIRHLGAWKRSDLWQGAMFLTEKQGGSDVGANTVQAEEKGGRWYLQGDKWFCSNVDAKAILALARMPGGPPGTKGLGLFLVLRERPEQNGQSIRIHRLKDKLGVRSMATGEVSFERTEAFLIGGIGQGFKQMAEMLNMSRLYNAVGSVAGMRRAISEALAYGAQRQAFGQPLWELPLWRASMADLQAEFLGAYALVFETVRALDRADMGDREAEVLVRLLTPMAKALCGKMSVFTVSESMEAIGGNAYIEESILPRLLRDCQVLPIWEGTTNILALDSLRVLHKYGAHKALFARIERALGKAKGLEQSWIDAVHSRMLSDQGALQEAAGLSAEQQQRQARSWIESASRTLSLALLLEAGHSPDLAASCQAAFERLMARPFGTAPLASRMSAALGHTEEPLLQSGYFRTKAQ